MDINVAEELAILRLGKPPEMRFKTDEDDSSPVFSLRVLTSAEELTARLSANQYMKEKDLPEEQRPLIESTNQLAYALRDTEGKQFFVDGHALRHSLTAKEVGTLLEAYSRLQEHYKTIDTASNDYVDQLVKGVAEGKLPESI